MRELVCICKHPAEYKRPSGDVICSKCGGNVQKEAAPQAPRA